MIELKKVIAAIPTLLLATVTMGSIVVNGLTYREEDDEETGGDVQQSSPTWATCRQRAHENAVAPQDARRDFVKSCLNSAREANLAAAL